MSPSNQGHTFMQYKEETTMDETMKNSGILIKALRNLDYFEGDIVTIIDEFLNVREIMDDREAITLATEANY